MKNKNHPYKYECPQCHRIIIGCGEIVCEKCDAHQDGAGDCHVGNRKERVTMYDVKCECLPQEIIGALICENIELRAEIDYLLSRKAVWRETFNGNP